MFYKAYHLTFMERMLMNNKSKTRFVRRLIIGIISHMFAHSGLTIRLGATFMWYWEM
jgi:hypothetical protein